MAAEPASLSKRGHPGSVPGGPGFLSHSSFHSSSWPVFVGDVETLPKTQVAAARLSGLENHSADGTNAAVLTLGVHAKHDSSRPTVALRGFTGLARRVISLHLSSRGRAKQDGKRCRLPLGLKRPPPPKDVLGMPKHL